MLGCENKVTHLSANLYFHMLFSKIKNKPLDRKTVILLSFIVINKHRFLFVKLLWYFKFV